MTHVMWLEHRGSSDYRLFDAPPTEPQGLSYDFYSLEKALLYAKSHNIKVIRADERKDR